MVVVIMEVVDCENSCDDFDEDKDHKDDTNSSPRSQRSK